MTRAVQREWATGVTMPRWTGLLQVALKFIHTDILHSRSKLKMLENEMDVMASLGRHQNVMAFYHSFQGPDSLTMVLEYLPG